MSDIDIWQKEFWNRLNQQMQENFKKQIELTQKQMELTRTDKRTNGTYKNR